MINIRLEAYKIIVTVLLKNVFSDKLLKQKQQQIQNEGQNSELLYVLVKGVLKMYKNLDYIVSIYTDLDKFKATNKKIKILLYMALYQLLYCDSIPDHAAVNESVELAKKLFNEKVANFINAVLRSYLRSKEIIYPEDPVELLTLKYSFPEEIVKKWIEYWGFEKTQKLCIYYNEVPKLNIRINRFATEKEKVKNYFHRRNVKLIESNASENILYTDQAQEVLNDVAFSEGYYSVQDPSAAMVVELMKPEPDESILDLFAAPGGKATYMAELMGNTGEIIAVEKFPSKIKKLKQAVERLQIKNIKIINQDAFKYGPVAPAFDKVLLDVPCTGWGVFQKKSELRWQINQDLPKLLKMQENALKKGAMFVKKDGYLIYSTCTLNKDENEKQIEKFLKKNINFTIDSASAYLPEEYVQNKYLQTLPFIHYMDGAFAAKLKKIS